MSKIVHSGLLPPLLALLCLPPVSARKASAADHDNAAQILQSRVPQEVRKFGQRLRSGPITVETAGTALYQTGAKNVEVKAASLTRKWGQHYVLKTEQRGDAVNMLEYCYGLNSKYCFELKKNKPRNAWLLSRCVFVKSGFDDAKQPFLLKGGFRTAVDTSLDGLSAVRFAQGDVSVERLAELPGFELTSAVLAGPEENILRASFNYQVTDPTTKKACRSICLLEFDLGLHCLPVSLHQSYTSGSDEVTHDWKHEWVKTSTDSYTVKFAIDTRTVSGTRTTQLVRVRTDMTVSTREVPESDFTLSAFGFPEPPGVEWKRPFPYYLVAAGVGTVCLGAFFFFRVRARRAAARG
jgi:hypothetical protein